MKQTKKRLESLFLCLVLLMSTCFGQCYITKETKAAESTKDMRNLTSMELVNDITLGWNLGNSLDSCVADRDGDGKIDNTPSGKVDETLWGNIRTTPEIFSTLKNQGFNAVRIPVTWRDHLGEAPDYLIDEEWMNRVQEVVDYAYNQDMYVIINLHHDGGDDTDFGAWIRKASTEKETVLEKYKAIWKQIAERFQYYSDYLIFESVNEVGFDDLTTSEGCELLNEINQNFVDLIRSSGGNNAQRHLLIGGYWTDITATSNGFFQMPKDPQNRCILSLHYYTPWQFCTTDEQKTWGSTRDGEEMQEKLDIIKENFTDQGIPVIIGEFGVGYGTEAESRIRFCGHLISRCKTMGVPCFYWDNGEEFNRSKLEWRTEGLAEAMLQAAGVTLSTTIPEPTKPPASAVPTTPSVPTNSNIPNIATPTPTVDIQPVPAVGSTLQSTTGSYQITKLATGHTLGTVSFKKAANKNIRQLAIPATITVNHLSYQVTAIQKNAFQGCKKLKKITIGSNIKKIGTAAFKGCKKLKTICVNTPSLKSVGKNAFRGIGRNAIVYVPGNKKKTLRKKLGIEGIYKKQIVLNRTSLTVIQGAPDKKMDTLKVIGSSKKVNWSSANRKIATVNSKGLVQGISGGETTITAKTAGKKLTCKVKVIPVLPVPMPMITPLPTIAPTSTPVPTVVPTSAPTPDPAATKTPKWTPLPLYSNEPDLSKNQEDVAALKKIAEKYPNIGINIDDLDSWSYEWSDNGRLTAINWGKIFIDGTLEISGFPALQSLELDRSDFTELKISDCESLHTVYCGFNPSLQKIDFSKATAISSINCSGSMEQLTEMLISDETKIESLSVGDTPKLKWDFTRYPNLESLALLQNRNETELDLSSNKKLKYLYLSCSDSQLSSLKVSEGIEELHCDSNPISSLDLSKSTNLRVLSCAGNQLSNLDLSHNKQLESVNLGNNQLTELDFSNHQNLTELDCRKNKLTRLTLDSCTKLESLGCSDNLLTDLDLSTCSSLGDVTCNNNSLIKLDFGNGKNLQYLNCENNQLELLELLDEKKLESVYCSSNQLTKLELDSEKLLELNCSDNKLEQLNFKQKANLNWLNCTGNQLTSLDVSNSDLTDLNCSDNPLNLLDISGCKNLQHLNFYHTDISSLDVSNFQDLKNIYCNSVDILVGWKYMEKDADDIAALEALIHKIQESYDASGVSDDNAKIDSNYLVNPQYEWTDGKLTTIHWDHCSLTGKLDVNELKNLHELSCKGNSLENLDISGCKELIILDCRENKLTEIDVSQNTSLFSIHCDEDVKIYGRIDRPIITPEDSDTRKHQDGPDGN